MDHEVTRLLRDMQRGDSRAVDQLVPIVYRELRQIAGALMRRERAESRGFAGLSAINSAGRSKSNRSTRIRAY